MITSTIFFVIFGVIFALVSYFGWQKLKVLPENKGLEPGAVVLRMLMTYSLTYFVGMQFSAMLCESVLLGSVQDANVNVPSRMAMHIVMGIISAVAAMTMTRFFGATVHAVITDRPLGVRMGLVTSAGALTALSFGLALFAPFYNLMAMANALHQTTELQIWWAAFKADLGFGSQAYVDYLLSLRHLPPDYAPFSSLHSGMVTSIGITAFHWMLTLMEILYTVYVSLTNQGFKQAILGDVFDLKPEGAPANPENKTKKENKGEGGEEKKSKNEQESKSYLEAALRLIGYKDEGVVDHWVTRLLPYITSQDEKSAKDSAARLFELVSKVKAAQNAAPADQEKRVKDLRDWLESSVRTWSNGALTLSKPKNR